MVNAILNYIPKRSVIHELTGTTKLFIFLLLSFVSIYTFDMRILFGLFVFCACEATIWKYIPVKQ